MLDMIRELFGGALTVSVPESYVDASNFRQIPDNQEVFVSENSDNSFIIEILEMPDNLDCE